MNRFVLIMLLFSCTQPEELIIETEEPTIDIDSLADATIEQVNKQKKQKVLLEQDLWRKKRDIKEIEKKFNESVYELNNLKLISEDSLVFDYKIVVKEIVDSVRITVSDSLCVNCIEIQKKKKNTEGKKTIFGNLRRKRIQKKINKNKSAQEDLAASKRKKVNLDKDGNVKKERMSTKTDFFPPPKSRRTSTKMRIRRTR